MIVQQYSIQWAALRDAGYVERWVAVDGRAYMVRVPA